MILWANFWMPAKPQHCQNRVDLTGTAISCKQRYACVSLSYVNVFQVFYTEIKNGHPVGSASLMEVPLSLDMLTTVSIQRVLTLLFTECYIQISSALRNVGTFWCASNIQLWQWRKMPTVIVLLYQSIKKQHHLETCFKKNT